MFLVSKPSRPPPGLTQLPIQPFRPGVKRLEREANHLPSFSADLENEWSYVSAPLYALMACTKTRFSWYCDIAFSFSVGRYSKCISVFHGIRNRLLIFSSVCVRAPVSVCVCNVGMGVRLAPTWNVDYGSFAIQDWMWKVQWWGNGVLHTPGVYSRVANSTPYSILHRQYCLLISPSGGPRRPRKGTITCPATYLEIFHSKSEQFGTKMRYVAVLLERRWSSAVHQLLGSWFVVHPSNWRNRLFSQGRKRAKSWLLLLGTYYKVAVITSVELVVKSAWQNPLLFWVWFISLWNPIAHFETHCVKSVISTKWWMLLWNNRGNVHVT